MDLNKNLVESSDDILREILVRLPPKSLFQFKCVSRRWNDLIMDPLFTKTYDSERKRRKWSSSSRRLLGFVQCNTKRLSLTPRIDPPWVSKHSFLSVGEEGHGGNFPCALGYFITYSNGFFLCGCIPTTYHVVNPMTKRWVSLPPPPQRFMVTKRWVSLPPPPQPFITRSVGLACEEDSNDYKVVVAGTYTDEYDDIMPLVTYSSVTGKWRGSDVFAPFPIFIGFKPPIVIGGVFHWLTNEDKGLTVYDFSSLEEDNAQLIELPFPTDSMEVWRTDNGETLWLGASNLESLKIFFLPIGKHSHTSSSSIIYENEWTLVHTVDMDTLKKDLIQVTRKDIAEEKRLVADHRSSRRVRRKLYKYRDYVYMAGVIPWDPRLQLVRLRESIYLYDFERKTVDLVELHGCPSFTDYEWYWYPYFESVSLSSYTFGLEQSRSRSMVPNQNVVVQR